jgi:acyl carrier protein
MLVLVGETVVSMHQTETEEPSSLDRVVSVIYSALSELNLQLPKSGRVEKSVSTVLFGEGGKLDSLALANFIVIVEVKLEAAFGFPFDLTQDDPFSSETGHFQTVQSLVEYIYRLVQRRSHTTT